MAQPRSVPEHNPELLAEWTDERDPATITYGSGYIARWTCDQGHTWKAPVKNRTKSLRPSGCPTCAGKPPLDQRVPIPEFGEPDFCDICGHEWRSETGEGCPVCISVLRAAYAEDDIAEFLSSGVIIERQPDAGIYIPEQLVAITVNAMYARSEAAGHGARDHRAVLDAYSALGIKLIQIWEDDWATRPSAVKGMLAHKLGLSMRPTVAARETQASIITHASARPFLEQHHTLGGLTGSHYLGLTDKGGELVAVMVLNKTNRKGVLSVGRYATSQRVPGGHVKLVKFAEESLPDWHSLVAFADAEVSEGSIYRRTGWVEDGELAPDYHYLVRGHRVHKANYRKKRFKSDPTLKYMEGMSERELALLNRLPRIWDSGKIRYRYTRTPL